MVDGGGNMTTIKVGDVVTWKEFTFLILSVQNEAYYFAYDGNLAGYARAAKNRFAIPWAIVEVEDRQ